MGALNHKGILAVSYLVALIVLLVLFFAGCWGPYFIRNVLVTQMLMFPNGPSLNAYLTWLGNANAAINPILYAALHQKICEEFMLRCSGVFVCITKPFKSSSKRRAAQHRVTRTMQSLREEMLPMQ